MHNAIAEKKRSYRTDVSMEDYAAVIVSADYVDPEKRIMASVDVDALWRVWPQLDERAQNLLEDKYILGMGDSEIWLAVEAVFLLIQNALVCRGAYLHGAGKVSAGLGAVGGMLGIASARVIGLLFSRGTILSVVILGFSALLGMVGTQYFLKIYYLKRFSLPDHI